MFHKLLDEGQAGDQVGLLLRGVKKDEVCRGMVLAKPGSVKLNDNLEAQVCLCNINNVFPGVSKHIEIICHYTKEAIEQNIIEIKYPGIER